MAERIHAVEKESGEWVTVEQRNSDYPRRCSSSLDDGQHDEQRAILPSGHSQKPMGNSIIQQTTTDWQKSEAEEHEFFTELMDVGVWQLVIERVFD